jgi:hypothetical protein
MKLKFMVVVLTVFVTLSITISSALSKSEDIIQESLKTGLDKYTEKAILDVIDIKDIEQSLIEGLGFMEDNEEKYKNLQIKGDLAYKMYYRQNGKSTLATYDESKNILDAISEQIMWTVPIANTADEVVATATFIEEEDGFKLLSFGEYQKEEFKMLSDTKAVVTALAEHTSIKNLTEIKAFCFPDCYLSGFYIKADNKEYIYPFQVNITPSIKAEKLYTVSEFIDLLRKDTSGINELTEKGEILYGGVGTSEKLNTAVVVTATILISLGVFFLCFYLNRRRKKV